MRDQDKSSEQALQASEERFRKVFEEGPIGVALLGLDARIQHANRRFCQMLAYSEEEIAALGIAGITHPDDYGTDYQLGTKLLRGEIPSYTIEKRYVRKNGKVIWGQLTTSMMHDVDGKPSMIINWFGSAADIDDQKRAELELEQAHDELEQRVKERTCELQRANERLQREIEERRRTEEALRQSHDELQAIYDGLVDGLLIADIETEQFVRANDSICRMLGYTKEELLSMSIPDIHPPEHVPSTLETFHNQVEGRIRVGPNIPVLRKDGSVFYADIAGQGIFVYAGRPCIIGFFRDITERKEAQEALRQSHDELRAIYDEMFDGIVIVDIETTNPVRANQAFCQMLGCSEDEVRTLKAPQVHPAEVMPDIQEHLDAVVQGRIARFENMPFLRRNGSVFYTDVVSRRILYNKRLCRISFLHDVTERKKAQEALRQSYDQLQAIYDGMVEGLVITEVETKGIRRVNSSFCRMLGYNEEMLLNMSVSDLHPPEEVTNDLKRYKATAEGRVSIYEDRPVLKKDGSVFYADITGRPILYQGQPCVVALFRDVTERRQTREALEREHRTLEHLLRASDHERQLIAYDIHDGLAQQLAGVIMQFQVYEQRKDTKPQDAKKAFDGGVVLLQQAHSEARRLISGVRPPILDASGVVAAVAHLVHDPAFDQGPQIDFWSKVTRNRLAPILENVIYRIVQEGLTNARNHSKSQKILVSLLQRGERLRIKIRDWGVGFNPKTVKENCFGLEGIRERARILGGKCSIKSKPGEGTRVVVELPIVKRGRTNSRRGEHGS